MDGGTAPLAAFPVITLGASATPFVDGQLYGLMARAAIERSIAEYRHIFGKQAGLAWDAVLAVAADVAARLPVDLVDEMKGVAEGAVVPWLAIVALNARTEILAHGRSQRAAHECTTVADASSAQLAQNWDWYTSMKTNCVIVRRPSHVCLTEAGILSKIGVNAHGIGVTLNLLHSRSDGLQLEHASVPIHLILHSILKTARTLDDVKRLCASSSASSCITAMDGAGNIACCELSPHGCFTVPADARARLVHTNHFLSEQGQLTETQQAHAATTRDRLLSAQEQLDGDDAVVDLRSLLALHCDRKSLCRHESEISTIACIVIRTKDRSMDVSGQPCVDKVVRTVLCDVE